MPRLQPGLCGRDGQDGEEKDHKAQTRDQKSGWQEWNCCPCTEQALGRMQVLSPSSGKTSERGIPNKITQKHNELGLQLDTEQ